MKKRDELAHESSCLNKAHDDELLFVLLERDAAAAATVRFWVAERIRLGKNKADDPQIIEALYWAESVELFALLGCNNTKTPFTAGGAPCSE